MKIAVISDIHGNYEALKTVLDYLQSEKISQIICLGDIVGYGPRPNECVDLVKSRCRQCLMGNHDHAALGLTDIYYFNEYAQKAILWTQRQLTQQSKIYLQNLPFVIEKGNLQFAHSSPLEPQEWHYVFNEADAGQNFNHSDYSLIFIGHSHIPVLFSREKGNFWETRPTLDLEQDRYIVNVGSVGQPRDGDWRSCFVIFDDESNILEYVRLEYPLRTTYQEILDHNLPPFLAKRLLAGQ